MSSSYALVPSASLGKGLCLRQKLQQWVYRGVRRFGLMGGLGAIALLSLMGQRIIQQVLRPQLLALDALSPIMQTDLQMGLQALRLILTLITVVSLSVMVLGFGQGRWVPRPSDNAHNHRRAPQSVSAETRAILQALTLEQQKSEQLLLNILPAPIAQRLKHEPRPIAEGYDEVTVMFADIVGFTPLSAQMSPRKLVYLLNLIFSKFDQLVEQHNLEKIKTIGDAYMVAGGLPETRSDHAVAMVDLAVAMQGAIAQIAKETGENLQLRIGIHTGPVVAGVIGLKKFSYDLWGDTVNIASRMESQGLAGGIQMSEETRQLLVREGWQGGEVRSLGCSPVKGKGEMRTYEVDTAC